MIKIEFIARFATHNLDYGGGVVGGFIGGITGLGGGTNSLGGAFVSTGATPAGTAALGDTG
jgi:hypothetical protein